MTFKVPNKYRVRTGSFGTTDDAGLNGLFFVSNGPGKVPMRVIATDGQGTGWEHVSVSFSTRCPTWEEMCKVKSLFWDDEDTVVQLHPPKSQWISNHSYCLHLWRNLNQPIELPPGHFVGDKAMGKIW